MKTVAIVGTFDSKGSEYAYLKQVLENLGLKTYTIHIGTFAPAFAPDVNNHEVAAVVGENLETVAASKDRGKAIEVLSQGITVLLPRLYAEGKFAGVIAMGGSGGTSLIAPAMRKLPIGVPKIIVSTVASGNTAQYVDTSDLILIPSIVDVAGINSISTRILSNAALALAGMVKLEAPVSATEKPLVAASMFGVTTPCIDEARRHLEEAGYEVLVFHATGTGGRTMESLIEAGFFAGVLDLTTTEWCDELVGGVLTAGPQRLEAAGRAGVPQVVSTGALDMVNFAGIDSVPLAFRERNLYKHNPTVTLMRTTVAENKELAAIIADKLNQAKGPTTLLLPLKGVSMIDAPGMPFYGPAEDEALFKGLRQKINPAVVTLQELDYHINDKEFAAAAAATLIQMMQAHKEG